MQFLVYCVLIMCFFIDECQVFEAQGNIGDFCEDHDGLLGNCTKIEDCDHAMKVIQVGGHPKTCGFAVGKSVVCCSIGSQINRHANRLIHFPTRRKSYNACVEYQEKLCPGTPEGIERRNPIIADGAPARFGQFPYVALLGFGEVLNKAHWWCSGSIISQRFVLTAGHCTTDGTTVVTFIRVGTLRRSDKIRRDHLHRVLRIYRHPGFNPPQHYNDIALLYTDKKITFNQLVRPACLHYDDDEDDARTIIAGWGRANYKDAPSDILQYAMVLKYSDDECQYWFSPKPPIRLLKYGFDATTQICYEHRGEHSHTCPGDTGGPLEVDTLRFPCLHTIIGVSSFGDKCSLNGEPGVYTRIAAYLPWIERIVWPPQNSNNKKKHK